MDLEKILFTMKTTFGSPEVFQIQSVKEGYQLNSSCYPLENGKTSISYISLNDPLLISFFDHFFRIIDSWKKEYVDFNSLDGMKWDLIIQYRNGDQKVYHGSGSYPSNFDLFEKYLFQFFQNAGRKVL